MSLPDVSERKEHMKLGLSLTSNPKDQSFVVSNHSNQQPWCSGVRGDGTDGLSVLRPAGPSGLMGPLWSQCVSLSSDLRAPLVS